MKVIPFSALRPQRSLALRVASYPYDLLSREEYRSLAEDEASFLHIIRSDIDLSDDINEYDEQVYALAKANLDKFLSQQTLQADDKDYFYVYEEVMKGRKQLGLVCGVALAEYAQGRICRHELTLEPKVLDRMKHMEAVKAQTGSVFLTYQDDGQLNCLLEDYCLEKEPEYHFIFPPNGVSQKLWLLQDDDLSCRIRQLIAAMDKFYVVDGHHRLEAAYRLSLKNPQKETYQWAMSVLFPASQLLNMANDRIIGGASLLDKAEVFRKIEMVCRVEEAKSAFRPDRPRRLGFYFQGQWYQLFFKDDFALDLTGAEALDVSLLQKYILQPVFALENPSCDPRFHSMGSIYGWQELIATADSDHGAAFTLYPSTVKEMLQIASQGQTMPPKSTWFEPKIISGLFMRALE